MSLLPPEIFKIELPVAFFFFVFALSYHCKFIINRVLTRGTWASLLIALNSFLVVCQAFLTICVKYRKWTFDQKKKIEFQDNGQGSLSPGFCLLIYIMPEGRHALGRAGKPNRPEQTQIAGRLSRCYLVAKKQYNEIPLFNSS